MAKEVYLIRSAPYDYLIPGLNLYHSFDLVGQGVYEVELDQDQVQQFAKQLPAKYKAEVVLSSPRLRSIQTGRMLADMVIIDENLREVGYTMPEIISEADFYDKTGKPNVDRARREFVQALIADELTESFGSVLERVENVLDRVYKMKEQKITLVSHGFFMKIFESYIMDPSIKDEPQRLLQYFDGSKETFRFGDGVRVE